MMDNGLVNKKEVALGDIDCQIDQAERGLKNVFALLDSLQGKISVIMRSEMEEAAKDCCSDPGASTELGSKIRTDVVRKINLVASNLSSIIDRIDI